MTVAHILPTKKKYKCDICGKVGFFQDDWRRYSSYAHDETCPLDVPSSCSDDCFALLKEKIDSGIFQLPKLRMTAGGFVVTKARKGY